MRDYKNHRSTPVGETAPPSPPPSQSESLEEASSPKSGGSGKFWLWILLFLVLIMGGAVVWWATQIPLSQGQLGLQPSATAGKSTTTTQALPLPQKPPVVAAAVRSVPKSLARTVAPVQSTTSPSASTASAVQFNFYRILPQMKVDIPADILGSGPGIPSAAATSQGIASVAVQIQVGALNNLAGAKVLQDRLALMGISSTVRTVQTPDKGQYFEVITRPYASLAAAQSALVKIRGMGVTPVLQPLGDGSFSGPVAAPRS